MNTETLTWATLIMASGSIIALVKFWVDMGKAWQRMDDGAEARALLAAKIDLIQTSAADFRVYVASNYATDKALADGLLAIGQRLDNVNQRLDALLSLARNERQ